MEHISWERNTFYGDDTNFMGKTQILWGRKTVYWEGTKTSIKKQISQHLKKMVKLRWARSLKF